jgi:hypothetical protein
MKSIDNLKRGPEMPIGTSEGAVSLKDAADMMNVGLRSANRARTVLAHGSAALQQAVAVGDIALNAAEEIAKHAVEEQENMMSGGGYLSDGRC